MCLDTVFKQWNIQRVGNGLRPTRQDPHTELSAARQKLLTISHPHSRKELNSKVNNFNAFAAVYTQVFSGSNLQEELASNCCVKYAYGVGDVDTLCFSYVIKNNFGQRRKIISEEIIIHKTEFRCLLGGP